MEPTTPGTAPRQALTSNDRLVGVWVEPRVAGVVVPLQVVQAELGPILQYLSVVSLG
jgi:hypothetical protein